MLSAKDSQPYFSLLRLPQQHECVSELLHSTYEQPRTRNYGSRRFSSLPEHGLELSFKADTEKAFKINAIFLHYLPAVPPGERLFKPPFDLTLGADRLSVHELIGLPTRSGRMRKLVDATSNPRMELKGIGDRYDLDLDYLHLEYDQGDRLILVTVGCSDNL